MIRIGRMEQAFRVFGPAEIVAQSDLLHRLETDTTLPDHLKKLYWSDLIPARHPDVPHPDVHCIRLEHLEDLIGWLVDRGWRLLPPGLDDALVSGADARTRQRNRRMLQRMGISAMPRTGIPQPRREYPTWVDWTDDPAAREKLDHKTAQRSRRRARARGEIVLSDLPEGSAWERATDEGRAAAYWRERMVRAAWRKLHTRVIDGETYVRIVERLCAETEIVERVMTDAAQ